MILAVYISILFLVATAANLYWTVDLLLFCNPDAEVKGISKVVYLIGCRLSRKSPAIIE